MAWFDKPLDELRKYRAPNFEPKDFDAFWKRTLAEAAVHPLAATFTPVDEAIYETVSVEDVSFAGFGGQTVKGWFIAPKAEETLTRVPMYRDLPSPKGRGDKRPSPQPSPSEGRGGRKPSPDARGSKKLPCVVTYIGYGGGRSLPVDHLVWAAAGLAHLVMDTRGQGANWSPGDTPDDAPPGANGPQFPGVMTRGIHSPESYYYRRVFTDAARAVEAAAAHPLVDAQRIAVTGVSQGGGITIAAAALCGKRVQLAMPDVPYLCHMRRATQITDQLPYSELVSYLKCHRNKVDEVFHTLSYFDGVNFAPRIKARCLFSTALMDLICPPSTVFAAYNAVKAPKDIRIYDYNNHEGGGMFQAVERLRFAKTYL